MMPFDSIRRACAAVSPRSLLQPFPSLRPHALALRFVAAASLLALGACSTLPGGEAKDSAAPRAGQAPKVTCTPLEPRIGALLPAIDPFMYVPDRSKPAAWLDRPLADGRLLREPINLVVVDTGADSDEAAARRLADAFTLAGFGARNGHSSGYWGKMDGVFQPQQPDGRDHAFSDYLWAFSNNHARMFGPHRSGETRVWIGSASRERGVAHDYVSFAQARNAMAAGLVAHAGARLAGCLPLGNRIDDAALHTGDHDGRAVVVELPAPTRHLRLSLSGALAGEHLITGADWARIQNPKLPAGSTIGLFTDPPSPQLPFDVAIVLGNIGAAALEPGRYAALALADDMPVFVAGGKPAAKEPVKAGFMSLVPTGQRPPRDEYVTTGGEFLIEAVSNRQVSGRLDVMLANRDGTKTVRAQGWFGFVLER